MGDNTLNTENRQKLIDTAKKLFWENGYVKTTLAQISEISGINNGLITYYFGSKGNLANEISIEYLLNLRNEIARQLYTIEKDYTLAIGVAVETRINLLTQLQNKNLMRFMVESGKDFSVFENNNSNLDKRDHYYQLQKRLINPNISQEDLKLYEVCGIAVSRYLLEAYECGFLKMCSLDYIIDYHLRLIFYMLQIPVYQAEVYIEHSGFLAKKINIKIGPGFKINSK